MFNLISTVAYYYKDPNSNKEIFVAVYVDDLLATGCDEFIKQLVTYMKNKFTVRDLGEAKSFLGMEIERDWKNNKVTWKKFSWKNRHNKLEH